MNPTDPPPTYSLNEWKQMCFESFILSKRRRMDEDKPPLIFRLSLIIASAIIILGCLVLLKVLFELPSPSTCA